MNAPTDKQRRIFEAFRRFGLPILGVAETIATKGASPGTTALRSEQIFQQQEDRARRAEREMEADALRRRVGESQLDAAKRDKEQFETEAARREEWEEGVSRLPDLTEIERLALRGAGPAAGIRFLIEKGKPGLAQMLLQMKLEGQEKLLGQKQQFELKKPAPTPKPKGLEQIPDKTREAITTDYNNIRNLQRVASKFDPKYVGPIKGRLGTMSEMLGTIGADEKTFRAEVQNYVDYLIKSITGAQMSEKEAQRIMRETVNFNVNPKAYIATLNSNIETIKMRLGSAIEGLKATGHDTTKMESMIDSLNQPLDIGSQQQTSEDQFNVGQVYTDAQGNKAKYLGNGQWEEVE